MADRDRGREREADSSVEVRRPDGASRLAHALRTPLTSLELRLRKLREVAREAGTEELVTSTLADVREIQRLLDDALALGGASTLAGATERVPLASLLARVAERMSALAAERRVLLEPAGASPTGVAALCDARAVEQILVNLCDNAIRFSAPGRAVRLTAHGRGGRVVIEVSDRGAGIAEEDLERVLEPYFKVDRESRSSGLGLAIASELARAQGGRLSLASKPGSGTTVIVELERAP